MTDELTPEQRIAALERKVEQHEKGLLIAAKTFKAMNEIIESLVKDYERRTQHDSTEIGPDLDAAHARP